MDKKIDNMLINSKNMPIILDGAMGTQIRKMYKKEINCMEELNLSEPEFMKNIYKSYVDSGAEIIQTNTFGATTIKLKRYNLDDKCALINESAAIQAKEAAQDKALVFGDIGPTGEFLYPYGTMTFDDMYNVFSIQVNALAKAGVDGFLMETFMDLEEARVALLVIKENTSLPVFTSFTYEKKNRTLMGNTPEAIAMVMQSMGADVVGANCSSGPAGMTDILKEYKNVLTTPLSAKPNAGLPVVIDGVTTFPLSAEELAEEEKLLIDAGANIIGGCCGSTPEHIKNIKDSLKKDIDNPWLDSIPNLLASRYQTANPKECELIEVSLSNAMDVFINFAPFMTPDSENRLPVIKLTAPIEEQAKLIADAQSANKNCFVFDFINYESAEIVLRNYCGRAGVIKSCITPQIQNLMDKYGALEI